MSSIAWLACACTDPAELDVPDATPSLPRDATAAIDATTIPDAAAPPDAADVADAAAIPDAPLASPDAAAADASPDAPPVDASPDAPLIDAAPDADTTGCAAPPVGDVWAGRSSATHGSSGSHDVNRADVTWTYVGTSACRDRYRPSGTATYEFHPHAWCSPVPVSHPIAATDGELVIDRTTAPPTYQMSGMTHWSATQHCANEPDDGPSHPVGGRWAGQGGSFEGRAFGGGFATPSTYHDQAWRFVRADAVFTMQPDGCVEPPAAGWRTVTRFNGTIADVTATWTRIATQGCVDTFAPTSGTVAIDPAFTNDTYEPASQPIEADDGVLTIDRAASPPRFRVVGTTTWTSTRTEHHADGTTSQGPWYWTGGVWASFAGTYDGDGFGAAIPRPSTDGPYPPYAWRFTRL